MPSALASSKLSRVFQVRKPVQVEVPEVTGNRRWGLVTVEQGLFTPLAASTWPDRGQIVAVVSSFPLREGRSLEGRWFYGK